MSLASASLTLSSLELPYLTERLLQEQFMTLAAHSPTFSYFGLSVNQGANYAYKFLPATLKTLFQTIVLGIRHKF
jgi:hypothetical protein